MIIKVRKKLYDSNKESIAIRLTNDEIARIVHNYLFRNPPELIALLNGTRRDDNTDDALMTSAEMKSFLKDLEAYLKKTYPENYKKPSSVEIA